MTLSIKAYGNAPAPVVADLRFKAAPVSGTGCAGCMFNHNESSVCHTAGRAAKLAGIPDCEDGFRYVPVEVDARQMAIEVTT